MSTTYQVKGMTCEGCVVALTNAIQSVAPDALVKVDLAKNLVAIDGFENTTDIAAAVEDAGFDFCGAVSGN